MALTFVLSSRVLEILPSHSCSWWLWLHTPAGCSNCPRWAVCSGAVCCCCARYKGKGRWLLGRSLVQARKLGGFTENALSGLLRILDQKCWLLALHGGKMTKLWALCGSISLWISAIVPPTLQLGIAEQKPERKCLAVTPSSGVGSSC